MSDTALMIPISEVQTLANAVAKSGLFPAFKTAEHALVLMMVAQAEGCHPIQATQRYDVIQGKPAKKADAMLADFQQRGGKVTWKQLTEDAAEAEFMGPGLGAPVTIKWTYDMATRAGLTGKPTWKQFRRAMLRSRVVSEGVRTAMPGVVAGLYTPEEVADFDAKPPVNSNAVAEPAAKARVTIDATAVDVQPVEPPPEEPRATPDAVRALSIAMTKMGIKDREDVLQWCAERIGHSLMSRKNLTASECSRLIDEARTPAPEPREPGEDS